MYYHNAARAGRIMIVRKSIMHQFVKFCILRFGQLNVVGSGQKFVWGPREILQHDYRRKKVKIAIFFVLLTVPLWIYVLCTETLFPMKD
jgi:hypothetical protein